MSNKLTCKICQYKSGNLVPHIEEKHETGLQAYMLKHGGISSVIHPELQAQSEKTETEGKNGMVKILGQKLQLVKNTEGMEEHLKPINKAYHFQSFTSEVIQDYQENRPVMLIGHTGTGKTSAIEQIAARINQPTIRVNMNGQISIADFTGYNVVRGGDIQWVDGILPYAMRNGLWLIIDEIDFGDPSILGILNPVLETNGHLVLKEKDHEVVKPHENFRLFATANTAGQYSEFRGLYQGTNIMNEAFLDRWRCYIVEYLTDILEIKVITESIALMTEPIAKEMVKVAAMTRQAFLSEELQATFSTRRLLDWASVTVRFRRLGEQAPFKAAEATIFSKISKEDVVTVKGYMQRILLGNTP